MAWFKTDDKLPNHRKSRAVRKTHPSKRRDVAPFGIWVLAGAWSDDGFVPLEVLEDWDDEAKMLADRLVRAGMWHPTKRDGEPGYVFHDWADHNPSRDDNDPSKSGTFGNHMRWHVQRGTVEPTCDHCPSEPDEIADDRPDHRGDIGAISPRIAPDIAPDAENHRGESLPTRPDPTRTRPEPDQTLLLDESSETDRFDEFWSVYDKKRGRKKAEQKWRLALRKPGVTADLLIAAAGSYVDWQRQEGKHPEFTKDPATWLNGEHWTDERVVRAQPMSNVQQHLALARRLAEQEQGATIREIGERR